MDGSRRRRHTKTPQARWLAVWRSARWGRRFMGLAIPPLAALILLIQETRS